MMNNRNGSDGRNRSDESSSESFMMVDVNPSSSPVSESAEMTELRAERELALKLVQAYQLESQQYLAERLAAAQKSIAQHNELKKTLRDLQSQHAREQSLTSSLTQENTQIKAMLEHERSLVASLTQENTNLNNLLKHDRDLAPLLQANAEYDRQNKNYRLENSKLGKKNAMLSKENALLSNENSVLSKEIPELTLHHRRREQMRDLKSSLELENSARNSPLRSHSDGSSVNPADVQMTASASSSPSPHTPIHMFPRPPLYPRARSPSDSSQVSTQGSTPKAK